MDENQSVRQLTNQLSPEARPLLQWAVTPNDGTPRLDAFLSARLPSIARREIIEWIANGWVCINNRVSRKGVRVGAEDLVTVSAAHQLRPNPDLAITVSFTDDALIVLDKPAGIPSIALRHDEITTVANFLLARFPETATVSPRSLEAGIVHRLDTATSGLLLVARTPYAYGALCEQFAAHLVDKHYLALVEGHLRAKGQRVSVLVPAGQHRRQMKETTSEPGQEARTFYTPVEQLPRHTLVRVMIPTGVRHQIRIHLAALGHSIVGDVLYGSSEKAARLCLHAESLTFTHPLTRKRMYFTSPLPEDFRVAQQQLASPWRKG